MNHLFSEISIRGLKIKNRIVMPPMVRYGYAGEDGLVTEKHLWHYEARARGGVGLIIIEATCVNPRGRLDPSQLGLWEDGQIEGFKRIARNCHQYGAGVIVQIHHAGLATPKSVTQDLIAPSVYRGKSRLDEDIQARAMAPDEIRVIQDEFLSAALRAQKAGLDGIELHGAHGYLISQFFSSEVNRRQDKYGGSLDNRVRIAVEIIQRIRKATGNDFIIGCRMGCNEPDLPGGIAIAQALEKAGVDLLHVSAGFGIPRQMKNTDLLEVPSGFNYHWIVYGGTEIKKKVRVPVIVVSGIKTPKQAAYLVGNDLADFTAIGRGLLVDPEWANKAQQNQEVITCVDCQPCKLDGPGDDCPRLKIKKK